MLLCKTVLLLGGSQAVTSCCAHPVLMAARLEHSPLSSVTDSVHTSHVCNGPDMCALDLACVHI